MDSSTSDFPITSDLDLTISGYNLNSKSISPIAIFLILILLVMLIGFFINNLSNNNVNINKFEPNLEKESKNTINNELKIKSEKVVNSSTDVKQALNLTNQELNNSINRLTDLVNKTGSENKHYNEEIQILEKNIEDLKSQIVILQSKVFDQELNKTEDKQKPILQPVKLSVQKQTEPKIKNINITAEPVPNMSYTYNNFQDDVVIYDPIANYDRLKLTDPLVDPRGRSSADQIPTPQVAAQLNFPTQGVIDRYHRVGLLIAVNDDSDNFHSNKKKLNVLETNADYSANTPVSPLPKFNVDSKNNKYNGVELVSDSSSSITNSINNNSASRPFSVYTSATPTTITTINPKTEKTNKNQKNRHRKHKHKKEHFELEGFDTENNYETFENNFGGDNESEYDYNDSDNFTNLENTVYEGFGNMESNKNIDSVNFGSNDNNILELIGKKITDNWYKYFTSISVGNKVIKINVHNRNRRELYSGDIVYISELGRRYRVQIDKMDMIEYNPYFF